MCTQVPRRDFEREKETQMHSGTGDPMCAGEQAGACGMWMFVSAEVAK